MRTFVSICALLAITAISDGATTSKPKDVIGSCGSDQTGESGVIASPNFPNGHYPQNSNCNYTVTVPDGSVIKFKFTYMDMEDGPEQKLSGCFADYIVITEVKDEEGPMVGEQRFCGHDTRFNSVYTRSNRAYIWFRTDNTIQMEGFVIRWKAVEAPKETFNCDFETKQGFCKGWKQLQPSKTIRWKVNHGQTRSSGTGPAFDHTMRNIDGSYVYAEATGMKRGEVTALISPAAKIVKTERYCLSFWYHMYGSGVGTLAVYDVNEDAGKIGHPRRGNKIFIQVGDQGRSWLEAKITINRKAMSTRFIFEATRGMSYRGDIAIDDITIEEDGCQEPK